ncbi:uncharacterized protein LOC105914509 [Setaria italica]|uniref:uncharacterized protein LOC105914509 n=1 Tax=Setaria italica TaxID=4555 RepID=UPI000BE60993|nr:uncharacterized protein LOC105914509 [Setaria italica]
MGHGEDDTCGEFCAAAFLVVVFVVAILGGAGTPENPVYHVGIDAVAGLNPSTDLARPALYPEFDLRVHIGQGLWGHHGDACLELGSSVAVSYRRVPLAAAAVPSRRCAGSSHGSGGGAAGSVPVVARGSGVRLPGAVRDALARDLWWGFGPAEFDVSLTVPYQGRWKVVSCKAKVGDAAALQGGPCNVTVVGTVQQASTAAPQIALPGRAGILDGA